jgi:hypothetical protein
MADGFKVNDLMERLQKLRDDADDCELISKLATDQAKREVFANLAIQLRQAAADVEQVMAAKAATGDAQGDRLT